MEEHSKEVPNEPQINTSLQLDPSTTLPMELFTMVLCWLDAETLRRSSLVSTNWASASNDNLLWHRLCDELWRDKLYVPKKLLDMRFTAAKSAYFESIVDSK